MTLQFEAYPGCQALQRARALGYVVGLTDASVVAMDTSYREDSLVPAK